MGLGFRGLGVRDLGFGDLGFGDLRVSQFRSSVEGIGHLQAASHLALRQPEK